MPLNKPQQKHQNRYLLKQAKLSHQQPLLPASLLLRLDTSSQRFMLLMLVTASLIPNVEASGPPKERSQSDLLPSTHGKLKDVFARDQNASGTVCPAVIPAGAMQSSVHAPQKKLTGEALVLSKTVVETPYAKKLSSTQIKKEREDMAALAQYSLRHPESAKKIDRVFNSKGFKLTVVDEFRDNPVGVGVYRNKENSIHVRSLRQLDVCDDIQTTFNHELHHAYVITTRTHGDPLANSDNEMTKPFSNMIEHTRLDGAINKGDMRVKKFEKLHHLAMTGNLQDPEEIKKYEEFKNALSDYQPRCMGKLATQDKAQLEQMKQKIKSGEKVRYGDLFVTHVVQTPQGTACYGHHIADGQTSDLNQKATAFIMDTAWRKNRFPFIYQKNSKKESDKQITTEMDAEINANSQTTLQKFYPELLKYHAEFRQKYEKENDNQDQLLSQQEPLRPRR